MLIKNAIDTFAILLWAAENVTTNTASANSGLMNMERRSIFQERVEPSPLGSSLYYGGQEDMYVCSSSNSTSQPYHKVSIIFI